jgi:hypothetical protein
VVPADPDAFHTQRAHARFLAGQNAHYLLVVRPTSGRRSQYGGRWSAHGERGRGHGRRETRAVRVLTVTDLGLAFPKQSTPPGSPATAPT